ncbi:MAG: hypothetical protein Q8K30_00800 [Candidatus Gracilibacteria bacterium]|nr:hypothetical protein [Candidatus Gracilibacteria bacterium]
MFFRRKKVSEQAKKIDKLITGLIIGGAVASMIGISQTKKGKEITKEVKTGSTSILKKGYSFFGKALVLGLKLFNKK